MAGALQGLRIIEMTGLGPAPFCGMMLADHGAEVIRIDRGGPPALFDRDILARSRKSIVVNLKSPEGVALVRELVMSADGLIEGFRPGVMERLGLGPDVLLADNPRLVYGRMTGWGQTGPYAQAAGHDINYISLSGALHTCAREGGQPTPPVNYVGDFGGGGMMLAFGMVTALLAVQRGGPGQVIDCAMTEGAALMMAMVWEMYGMGVWNNAPGTNLLDTGRYFYDTYKTSDGKWISIGALEPQFFALLKEKLGLTEDSDFAGQENAAAAPGARKTLERIFASRTCEEWCVLLEGTDTCFAPVLSLEEAPRHPHNIARGVFTEVDGMIQAAPGPKFSATPPPPPRAAPKPGADTDEVLRGLGLDEARIAALRQARAVG